MLPPEILRIIASLSRTRELVRISSASRSLRIAAFPFLYAELMVTCKHMASLADRIVREQTRESCIDGLCATDYIQTLFFHDPFNHEDYGLDEPVPHASECVASFLKTLPLLANVTGLIWYQTIEWINRGELDAEMEDCIQSLCTSVRRHLTCVERVGYHLISYGPVHVSSEPSMVEFC